MAVARKCLLGAGILAVLIIFYLAAEVRHEQVDRGGEWLSWSPRERSTYVSGFITGYLQGSNRACNVAQELFGVGKTYRLGDENRPSEMPAARCLARMETYSKASYSDTGPEFGAYTNVITEFYTKYPEYRGIPFFYLMQFLSDNKYKTADELHQMAIKGDLRTVF